MRSFVVAVALLAGAAQAQEFRPGYLVVDGDTVRGEVALGVETENAVGVRFRPTGGAERPVGPADASAVGVDGGRRYRSGRFRRTASRRVSGPLFARVVREGTADLLSLEVSAGRPVFFVQLGGETVGLYLDRDAVRGPEGIGYRERERPLYRQALRGLLGPGCPSLPDVRRLDYTERAIGRVVDAYNACADAGYVAGRAPGAQRRGFRFGADLGLDGVAVAFRRTPPPGTGPGPDDPGVASVRLGAAVYVSPPYAGDGFQLALGLEYEPTQTRIVTGLTDEVTAVGAVHGRLGVQYVVPRAGVHGRLGGGLLIGRARRRVVETDAEVEGRDDLVRGTNASEFGSSSGVYVELGVGPPGGRVEGVVRAQSTGFTREGGLVPFVSGPRYGTRSLSMGARVRL